VNVVFHVDLLILHFVVRSAAEAKLSALFYNCQMGIIFQSILEDIGHPQPKTPMHCNNAMAVGIANSSVKHWRLHLMEMRFFGLVEKSCKICTHYHGIQDKRILQIIKASIICDVTT
jgi:hypothetical protein